MRPLLLTERQPTACTLSDADLDFLLAGHASHLRIAPAMERKVVLTPTCLVGLINCPSVRLVVLPKVPLRSFAHLFGAEYSPTSPDDGTEFDLLDFMALRLAALTEDRLIVGLQRGYMEHRPEGPFVRGRLDLAVTLHENPRRDRLHSRSADLSTNVPCDQIVLSTVELLLQSSEVSE